MTAAPLNAVLTTFSNAADEEVAAAELAEKAEPKNGAILDTLAHLVYENGDLDRAIELQKRAVKNAGPQLDEIEPFLKELEAKKKKKESDEGS